MGPIGRFMRSSLRRRLFAWFLTGLLVTSVVVGAATSVFAHFQDPSWGHNFDRSAGWVGEQFAREWDDPVRREAFARKTAAELDLDLVLLDPQGHPLVTLGEPHHGVEVPVLRDGKQVGLLRANFRRPPDAAIRFAFTLAVFFLMLWVAAGKVARRLARPLDDLTQVVEKIGSGDLKARAELSCYDSGEIGLVAEAVNEMAARIEKQMIDQRELIAAVSHELRTPLARMRIISELGRDGAATRTTFDDLDREVTEMDSLVGELLASSRIDFGQVAMRELSVRDLVTRALERSNIDPSLAQVEGDADRLSGDPTLLLRALANLLENARNHGGGVELLKASIANGRVRFEVLDAGPGLPNGGQGLFDKFTKATKTDGLGLGLALVKRIVDAHQGQVFGLNREGGKGACVGFEFPLVETVRPPEAVPQPTLAAA
jgi:signal transduction histidine kinase